MKCPSCDKEYRKTKTPLGRWHYERACSCKLYAEHSRRLTEKTRTRPAPRCN